MISKLISSDLNGTLVHQHTMSDMIRLYLGQESFEKANAVFKKQTSGTATMEEAFENAGPLTKGLTLRQAIDYTTTHMRYVNGFADFVDTLHQQEIPLVINSTGYSVTIYAIQAKIGRKKIHGQIGNRLLFGEHGSEQEVLREEELKQKVISFINDSSIRNDHSYDIIKATGTVELGIWNEDAKSDLLWQYARRHFPPISNFESYLSTSNMIHMGDTMGDSGGIYGIANGGGLGIAFNYNKPLEQWLLEKIASSPNLKERILFVDPKGEHADLKNVLKSLNLLNTIAQRF